MPPAWTPDLSPSATEKQHEPVPLAGTSRTDPGTPPPPVSPSRPPLGRREGLVLLLAGLLVWASFLQFPDGIATVTGPLGWQQAHGYFLRQGFQAGEDFIFTFGPLGYFFGTPYDAELFWWKYAWELLVKLAFAVVLLRVAVHLPGCVARLSFCALAAYLLPLSTDALYTFVLLAMGVLLLLESHWAWPALLALTLLAALLALVKFTFTVNILLILAIASAYWLVNRRPLAAVALPLLFIAQYLALWVALGQSLAGLPRYLRASWEVAAGYGEGMAVEGFPDQVYSALILLFLLAVLAVLVPLPRDRRCTRLAVLALFGVCLLLQWKHSFTSHGRASLRFFSFTALVPFLYLALCPPGRRWGLPRLVPLAACVALAAGAFVKGWVDYGTTAREFARLGSTRIVDNAVAAAAPCRKARELEALRGRLRERWQLPRVKAEVGPAPIDVMFYHGQGVALLNELNWRPRPVYQSYSAYTPFLLAENARFFQSDKAPPYVLFRLRTIFNRFPALDDSPALSELFRHYRPVLTEKSFILFKRVARRDAAVPPRDEAVVTRVVRFGEEVEVDSLPGRYQTVMLDFKPAPLGKLRAAAYRPPAVSIEVTTTSGQVATYRMIPAMARVGFLLNPLLQDNHDVLKLYAPSGGTRVKSFRLLAQGSPEPWFDPAISVTVKGLSDLVCCRLPESELNRLLYPMLKEVPAAVRSDLAVTSTLFDDTEVLLVPPVGEVRFKRPPMARQVVAQFGILPSAYLPRTMWETPGIRFLVDHVAEDGRVSTLFERRLDPERNEKDRGLQRLAVSLPARGGGEIVFRTLNVRGEQNRTDLSFWTDIDFR
ncbi:MAG TPA: hypothetical protein VNK04_07130 [Gemmataceae bacterium]|nr:hypothetical protein [Gemmataceae bacterium]